MITPKQLLRLKAAASSVEDFTQGRFKPVIEDQANLSPNEVTNLVFVSGRLYYDLEAERAKRKDQSTALVRGEQLYPLPVAEIKEQIANYPNAEVLWAQDEPANQGQWPFMALNLMPQVDYKMRLISRPAAASPAAGTGKRHQRELDNLISEVFDR